MDTTHRPTLYLVCGKIAAGKSTLASHLAARPATLLISEDHWTSNLFADDLQTIDDYARLSARLRAAMGRTLSISCSEVFRLFSTSRQTPSRVDTGCVH